MARALVTIKRKEELLILDTGDKRGCRFPENVSVGSSGSRDGPKCFPCTHAFTLCTLSFDLPRGKLCDSRKLTLPREADGRKLRKLSSCHVTPGPGGGGGGVPNCRRPRKSGEREEMRRISFLGAAWGTAEPPLPKSQGFQSLFTRSPKVTFSRPRCPRFSSV